jgi:aminoglycoside phosphotransferase family enzyme/predicted kinase
VAKLELIETHISWIILTGEFAYKIKKPVDLGFVDFRSLARRKYFCEEELRLNLRTAADLYLDIVPIAATAQGLRIGQQPAIEYAVRMRQFPGDARLDRQLESGRLTVNDMLAAAQVIADFHGSLTARPLDHPADEIARISQFALDNFTQIRVALNNDHFHPLLAQLEAWARRQIALLEPAFKHRAAGGFVREGHGDLHLANMVRLEHRIVLFDCLEFDPGLRWLDLMNDIAFLVMDLMAHRREDLAYAFLNAYLEHSGDYPGLAVLRFYLVYRCLVRAKVAALQPSGKLAGAADNADDKTRRYLELARALVAPSMTPRLVLMHGFSGAGKSWLSSRLMGGLGAIRVRSDLERKRLHGLAPAQDSGSGIETGLYNARATEQTYDLLARYCGTGLRAGFNMIADASFLRRRQRQRFADLAKHLQAELFILDCTAPPETLRERVQKRAADPQQVSEAGLAVLEHQLAQHDAFTHQEEQYVIRFTSEWDHDVPGLLQQLLFSPHG